MLKVAITGNIAAGKSEVETLLREQGYKVFDSDVIAHDITSKDEKLIVEIKNLFKGYDILDKNAAISRPKLGKLVFSNKELLVELESIIHPAIKERIKDIFLNNPNEKVIFVAVPLLFEKNFRSLFDKVILVLADEKRRLDRLLKRSSYDIEHAKSRIKSQLPQEKKIPLCDFLIENNHDLDYLKPQVDLILKKLKLI